MSAEYSAIAAKLRAMYAKSLTDEEFSRLAEKKTVGEICSYLKGTEAYGAVLEEINESDAHRGEMEMHMNDKLMQDIMSISRFTDGRFSDMISFLMMRGEIEFLKKEVHYIYTREKRTEDSVEEAHFEKFFNGYTKIDRESMRNAESIDDCIAACKNTKYIEPLRRAANLKTDFFATGMLLDGFYYRTLWKAIHTKLAKNQVREFEKFIGSFADMHNLLWIYRGKKYFDFENEIIFTFLLNIKHRLSEDMIKRLVLADTIEDFVSIVRQTPYAELFAGLEDGVFPEENFQSMDRRMSMSILSLHSESIVAIFAYAHLKQCEIWRITTVIEGVRYGENPESIKAHIRVE